MNDSERLKKVKEWEEGEWSLTRHKPALEEFENLCLIGRGAFGEVHLVRRDSNLYALKRIENSGRIPGLLRRIATERDALVFCTTARTSTMPSTFIGVTPLHYSFRTTHSGGGAPDAFYLVTPFYCGGDLMQLLIAKGTLPEALMRLYAAELTLAIDQVHRERFIHRDLKPDNILIDENGHLWLGDLGLSFYEGGGGEGEGEPAQVLPPPPHPPPPPPRPPRPPPPLPPPLSRTEPREWHLGLRGRRLAE